MACRAVTLALARMVILTKCRLTCVTLIRDTSLNALVVTWIFRLLGVKGQLTKTLMVRRVGTLCWRSFLNRKWVIVVRVIRMLGTCRILILINRRKTIMAKKLTVLIARIIFRFGMVVGTMVRLLVIGRSMSIFVICVFWKGRWVASKGLLIWKFCRSTLTLTRTMLCRIAKRVRCRTRRPIRIRCRVLNGFSSGRRIRLLFYRFPRVVTPSVTIVSIAVFTWKWRLLCRPLRIIRSRLIVLRRFWARALTTIVPLATIGVCCRIRYRGPVMIPFRKRVLFVFTKFWVRIRLIWITLLIARVRVVMLLVWLLALVVIRRAMMTRRWKLVLTKRPVLSLNVMVGRLGLFGLVTTIVIRQKWVLRWRTVFWLLVKVKLPILTLTSGRMRWKWRPKGRKECRMRWLVRWRIGLIILSTRRRAKIKRLVSVRWPLWSTCRI